MGLEGWDVVGGGFCGVVLHGGELLVPVHGGCVQGVRLVRVEFGADHGVADVAIRGDLSVPILLI